MVVGLLGNESPDSNRFTLVIPKPANGVRLQATLGNQNPTGLPVGAVSVDEAQFCSKSDIEFFVHIVDDLEIPVLCYGLRTDFQHNPFEGSIWLLTWSDVLEEVKTVCWCGQGASCNARFDESSHIIKNGEQVLVGANEKYIALCRKHYRNNILRASDN